MHACMTMTLTYNQGVTRDGCYALENVVVIQSRARIEKNIQKYMDSQYFDLFYEDHHGEPPKEPTEPV
jgi:hypothetical protein